MSRKFAVGVTLTEEEKARIGFDSRPTRNRLYTGSQSATSSTLVRSWTCEVPLPDGTTCSAAYQRDGPRCHRFSYREPLRERVWHMHPLEGGAYAIEQKAQELAKMAFALAQTAEQKEMRRATPSPGRREHPLPSGMERLRVKTAKELGGLYAICLRFASGNLIPVGMAHAHPDAALAEYESGQHADTLSGSTRYVIGICCRWQRRWIEPQFLAQRLPGSSTREVASQAREKAARDTKNDATEEDTLDVPTSEE